jgi:hypothetical protein
MPICVTNVELGRPLPPPGEEACKPGDLVESVVASTACADGTSVASCSCEPGAEGAVRSCVPNAEATACEMTLYCFGPGDCSDASVAATCAP